MQMCDSGDIVMIRWRTTPGVVFSMGERSSPVHRLLRPFACMRTITRWRKGASQKGVAGLLQAKDVCLLLFLRAFHSPKQYSWKVQVCNCVKLFCCCVIKPQRWINFVNWSSFQGCSNIQGWWASVIKVANQIIGARSRCAERGVSLLLLNSADENLIAYRALRMQRQMVHSSCKITTLKEH